MFLCVLVLVFWLSYLSRRFSFASKWWNCANLICISSFWAMLLSKCRQNLERHLPVYLMRLLETRLKLLSALLPCSEVRIMSSYTWDALFTSYFRWTTYRANLRNYCSPIHPFKALTWQHAIDARFHPIQYPPCPRLLIFSWLALFPCLAMAF